MHYRRRLRSRIIVSFLLLGFGLTAMFAVATVALRNRLEGQLLDSTLQDEADSLNAQVRADPNRPPTFSFFDAGTFSERTAYKLPMELQTVGSGVYDLVQTDLSGRQFHYKYAIRRNAGLISWVRYDVTGSSIGERQMLVALLAAVFLFTGLAWVIGLWSSSRVISPLTELARRVKGLSSRENPDQLAPHFPRDEVGELADALDDYADRMTRLVKRDREFNADVSHELRTPLAVIRGAAELLMANPNLEDKTRQRLARIERAAIQCTDLTTALLLLSRNERGSGSTNLFKVCQALAEANRAQLGNRPIEIIVEGRQDVVVNAPEAVLAVALGNLIGNACKYTAEGEVRVIVEGDRVHIEDTGHGISAEDAARLFERGYRGLSAGGTSGGGIGLSIVRRLCELYAWTVSIAPRPDRGAKATLVFDASS
ncbi:MAG: HAMP domain-containing histidine kinase [Frankiaceae bacterium]|nr:HAMP domain-containing histidine kinase [Arenimonas sp.]